MDNRSVLLAELKSEEKALIAKRERLRKPLAQVEEDLQHITAVIALYERRGGEVVVEGTLDALECPPSRLRGMTQLEAIVEIAHCNNGVVRAQDAKRLMIKAGVMKATKNSTNMTHGVIIRSERFDRVKPGEYRLKEVSRLFDNPPQEARSATLTLKPVQ
jgi:hypothetical protein